MVTKSVFQTKTFNCAIQPIRYNKSVWSAGEGWRQPTPQVITKDFR